MRNGSGKSGGKAGGKARKKRRRYGRSTPVGRVRKNLEKMLRVADLVGARLRSWLGPEGAQNRLSGTISSIEDARRLIHVAIVKIGELERAKWSPSRRSSAVVFEAGASVRIADTHRGKYLEVYGDDVINHLTVQKVLDAGIAVQHGKRAPFIVPKSHLKRAAAS